MSRAIRSSDGEKRRPRPTFRSKGRSAESIYLGQDRHEKLMTGLQRFAGLKKRAGPPTIRVARGGECLPEKSLFVSPRGDAPPMRGYIRRRKQANLHTSEKTVDAMTKKDLRGG